MAAKVLVVDDEPAVRFTLREVLVERGHTVVEAASGAAALDLLEGVSAAVTDLAMPGMDGLALLAAIRDKDPSLPVILLTAHGSEKVAVQAMKAGAYDYAAKPFDIDEIVTVVERALEARALRTAARHLGARLNFDETSRLLALCGFLSNPTVASRTGTTLHLSNQLRAERSHRELRLSLHSQSSPK